MTSRNPEKGDSEDEAATGLLPQHAALIAASAISPEVASARGYRSATSETELADLGFSKAQRLPGLVFPVRDGPKSSGEIAGAFDAAWPTITAHLQALKDAGLVSAQRAGGAVTYRLEVSVMEEAATALMALLRVGGKEKPK